MFGRKKRPIDSSELVLDGWRRTTAALEVLARDASEHEHWIAVAGRWAATAVMPPALLSPDGRVPLGFSLRPDGSPQDAAVTERALADLTRLIDADVSPEFLLPMRAELEFGWRRYADAQRDWQAAIDLLAAEPGRSADQAQIFQRMNEARQWIAMEPRLSDEDLEGLREAAAQLGTHAAQAAEFEPSLRTWVSPGSTPLDLDDRLRDAAEEVAAAGLGALGWCDDVTLAEQHGKQATLGVWLAGAHTSVVAGAMGPAFSCDLESWLSDGRHVVTTRTRGQTNFGGGPWIDRVNLDAVVPIDAALAFHKARVHALLVTTPGLEVVAVASIDDWEAMQEDQRQRRLAHRLEVGLNETEARGIPFGPPDITVPMLQAAARDAVARAAAERLPRAA